MIERSIKKKIIAVILTVCIAVGAGFGIKGIIDNVNNLTGVDNTLPDFVATPSEGNSWDYWTDTDYDDGEVLNISWFDNTGTISWPAENTAVAQRILEKTGCKISVTTATDNQKLTSLISGNNLPDIVTVNALNDTTWIELAENKRLFPLTDLAERWAPDMMNNYSAWAQEYYKASDGKLYVLPGQYYPDETVKEHSEQGGYYYTNGSVLAREDWLKEYLDANPHANPTTPDGFIEMCKWVQQRHFQGEFRNYSVVQLREFSDSTTSMNSSIRWLAQYFAVPREDSDGNLTYTEAQDEYKEMLLWLNELYRENLLKGTTFTDKYDAVNANVGRGIPFVVVGGYNYFSNIYTWNKNPENEGRKYVPIVFTNSAGDAPVLQDMSGTGLTVSMISSNCKRPDRVIKLFDYLNSTEGQILLSYGIEGEHFTYDINPGEVRDGITYKYGRIAFTEKTKTAIRADSTKKNYGFVTQVFSNRPLLEMVSPNNLYLINQAYYIQYNSKAALQPYTFSAGIFNIKRDASDSGYEKAIEISSKLNGLWNTNFSLIIAAESASAALANYRAVLNQAESLGYKTLLEFDNVCFKREKAERNIEFAWPPNTEEYKNNPPTVSIRGYYNEFPELEIPEWMK